MKIIFYIDLDDVTFDRNVAALSLFNLQNDDLIRQALKEGQGLTDLIVQNIDEFEKPMDYYQYLGDHEEQYKQGHQFFPWMVPVFDFLIQEGFPHYLSAVGNPNMNKERYNRILSMKQWLIDNKLSEKYQFDSSFVPTGRKFDFADSYAFLLDDDISNVVDFKSSSGYGLVWPNQYVIEDALAALPVGKDITSLPIFGQLERTIKDMKSR